MEGRVGVLVVDLRHWLLDDGQLAPQVRLAPHIAMIVECATIVGEGTTAMVCRHSETRRRCGGQVHIRSRNDTIDWSCNVCDDAGVITGWRGSRWDLSDVDIGPDDEEHALYLPLDELRVLRDLELVPAVRATLAGAMPVDERHACVPLTEAELVGLVAAIVRADAAGATRRRLDRALGRVEQLLVTHQLARRADAH